MWAFDPAVQRFRRTAALRDEWSERIDAESDRFVDELVSRGFTLVSTAPTRQLVGELSYPPNGEQTTVEITLPEGWPYRATRVRPTDWDRPLSWHQEGDGSLCLFPTSAPGLPWRDPDQLLSKVAQWFAEAAAGWPNDEPDLDLERYFASSSEGEFLFYEDLGPLLGRQIKVARTRQGSFELRPSGKSAAKGSRYGWALDLGELAGPLRTWEEILSHVGEDAARADRLVKQVESAVVLLRYQRGSHEGVVALRAQRKDGKVRLESIESASKSSRTLHLRAGYDASDLSRFTVAIVGIGAIGSHLADQLCRGGVGQLLLVDSERMRPGNSIRHLLGLDEVGQYKTEAVARHIRNVGLCPADGLSSQRKALRAPDQAASVFEDVDLVIDATGNPTTSALLADAAESHRKPLLITYLQRDGDVVRVERYPIVDGEDQEPPVPPGTVLREVVRESGCGDPVSPAPPSSASVAAGLAALAAADVLLGRDVPPALTHVLRPQPDQPYRQRSVRP